MAKVVRFNFFDWLKELFNIDFTNRGKNPFTNQYDTEYGATAEDLDNSSSSGLFGLPSFTSFGELLKALVSRLTGAALTPAEREASALQLSNQQTLNEEDYQRKIDFYERYESPQAQVQQYKAAGLNPALLYGGGASVSASGGVGTGSAGMPSAQMESIAGIISAISGASLRSQQQRFDMKMRERELELEGEKLGIYRNQSEAYARYLGSQTTGQDITNSNLQDIYDLNKDNVRAKTGELLENIKTAPVQRALLRADIGVKEASEALYKVQTRIASADADIRAKYNAIMIDSARIQMEMLSVQSEYQRQLLDQQVMHNARELNILFNQVGMSNLDLQYYRADRNWEHGLGFARTVVTAGGIAAGFAFGGRALGAASVLSAPTFAQTLQYGSPGLWSPSPQYYGPLH